MNIENIALVRATNIIPTEGIIVPVSEAKYIKKSRNEPLATGITSLLKREGIITPIDFTKLDDPKYIEEKNKEITYVTHDYIPYTSDYNSMLLFSLNGLVPDDKEAGFGNNTFSDKKCAIIDSLSSHIDEVISLNPTDTAIKGTMSLSSDGVILIEKDTYDNLSLEDKTKLSRFNVQLFEGTLKSAVENFLKNSKRYTCEQLALSSSKGGYIESPTSEELKQTIKQIAAERKLSTAYHLNIILHNTEPLEKLKPVEKEHENILKVKQYYQNEFYKYLFSEMEVDETLRCSLLNYSSETYIDELCKIIKNYGIENYKKICNKFNYILEHLKHDGSLPSPQYIVDCIDKGEPFDLCALIRSFNINNYQLEKLNKIPNNKQIEDDSKPKGKSI